MIASPGLSTLPSPLRSSRLPPDRLHDTSSAQHRRRLLLGAREPFSTFASSGTVSTASTLEVAASFIAEATAASDHLPLRRCWARSWLSSDTRADEPLRPHASSAAPKPWAALLFQLTIVPFVGVFTGSIPCGWPAVERKPRHSYLPLPTVGRLGSSALGAQRQQPGGDLGNVLGVDVERVERLGRQRRCLDERLRAVHLAVRQPPVEQQIQRVLAVAGALAGDRHAVPARPSRTRSTGPLTVVMNLTGAPLIVPASNSCILTHLPWYRYFVRLWPHSVSAN